MPTKASRQSNHFFGLARVEPSATPLPAETCYPMISLSSYTKMRVSMNGGSPIAGWFISWKIPSRSG